MGTLTVNPGYIPVNAGSEMKVEGTFAFGNSYATGGESFTAAQLGMSHINRLVMATDSGYLFETNYTTNKVLVYAGAGGGGGDTGDTSGGTPSGTNAASAVAGTAAGQVLAMNSYTPAGTVQAAVFSGDALGAHDHDLSLASNTSVVSDIKIYLAAVAGAPAPGDTVTGGTSSETATVSSYDGGGGFVIVTGPSGTFTTGEALSFAPSGATATMRGNLVDSWTFAPPLTGSNAVLACNNQNGDGLQRAAAVFGTTQDLSTNQYRFFLTSASLDTNHGDGWTGVAIEYINSATDTSTAGTPSGTINAQTFSGTPATLTGTNSDSALTATAAAQVFSGDLLAVHHHTGGAGGSIGQVTNGTDLSALTAVAFEAYGS